MTKILLISEDYIKTNSNLNDNVWGEYLLPAIREAQDMGLQEIIGECLYKQILYLVDTAEIADDENAAYKYLLDEYIQPYLMYQVLCDLVPIIGTKQVNLGTVISNDEHVVNLSESERNRVKNYYQIRADFYCRRMQEYVLNNRDAYPELRPCDCDKMQANLKSAATTGLFLGGYRGRRVR
jgi:hypothetical protein